MSDFQISFQIILGYICFFYRMTLIYFEFGVIEKVNQKLFNDFTSFNLNIEMKVILIF